MCCDCAMRDANNQVSLESLRRDWVADQLGARMIDRIAYPIAQGAIRDWERAANTSAYVRFERSVHILGSMTWVM